jgi:hypothetical protein
MPDRTGGIGLNQATRIDLYSVSFHRPAASDQPFVAGVREWLDLSSGCFRVKKEKAGSWELEAGSCQCDSIHEFGLR